MLQITAVKPLERVFHALGTVNYIKIYDPSKEVALNLAIERVQKLEKRLSAFLPESDIGRINKNAGKGYVPIHEETLKLLQRGNYFSKLSKGSFDMTVRPLVQIWGIGKKENYIPSIEEINTVHKLIGYKNLLIDKKHSAAMLKHPGQAVDLGGIAKGYAADEAKRILRENKVEDALINLGGNVVTMGQRPEGGLWRIGIQNPLKPTGNYIGTLSLTEKTIVTSGSNERFFMKDGIRYHHILDPRTGCPACTSLLSVTVVGECSMDADALTTALFVLGLKDGISLLRKLKAEALFIMEDLGIYLTDGLKDIFSINPNASYR